MVTLLVLGIEPDEMTETSTYTVEIQNVIEDDSLRLLECRFLVLGPIVKVERSYSLSAFTPSTLTPLCPFAYC
jgi:hypothetical protein